MSGEHQPSVPTFQPLVYASKRRLVLAAAVGGLLWVAALVVGAIVLERRDAIELGLLIAAISFVVSLIVLTLLRAGRKREERRYESG
jgi:hypothetical protein